jgi:hypothetical protein
VVVSNHCRSHLHGSRHDLPTFALETTGGHGAWTSAVYYVFTKLYATRVCLPSRPGGGEALKHKLKKDISCALRRGTIAQVTTALDAAQSAAEAELTVNEVGLAW